MHQIENKKEKENELENILFLQNKNKDDILLNENNITKEDIIKELLIPLSKKKGYSLGISGGDTLGLIKDRRKKNMEINIKFSNYINDGFKLNIKKSPIIKRAFSQKEYEECRKAYYK